MRTSRAVTALIAAGLLAATATGAASPAAASPAGGCASSWKLISAPAGPIRQDLTTGLSIHQPAGMITGVAADRAGDAWFPATDIGVYGTLSWAYHWDGHKFGATTMVPEGSYTGRTSATGEPFDGPFVGPVSFDSGTDGWAIGDSNLADISSFPYWAARWSGGRWTITPLAVSPDPASVGLNPRGVAAVSPTDAWAVGYSYNVSSGSSGALIEHWDGSRWSIFPNPASGQANTQLNSITAVSANDIWAVGASGVGSGQAVPLAEHWNGTAWSVVPTPAGHIASLLYGASADGHGGVWAVGAQLEPGSSNLITGFVEHWDGHTWSVVTSLPHLGNSELLAVYAASPSDVWATVYAPRTNTDLGVDEFLHWDGSSWTTVPVPGPHEYGLDYEYTGIAGTGPGNIWAAGYSGQRFGNPTPLIAHLGCGQSHRAPAQPAR